jgi:hypothetical protein
MRIGGIRKGIDVSGTMQRENRAGEAREVEGNTCWYLN